MNVPGTPDGRRWPELLAAYADGELDDALRAEVEARLEADPALLADLADQEALSPRNLGFWRVVRPPEPGDAKWRSARAGIAARLGPATLPLGGPAPGPPGAPAGRRASGFWPRLLAAGAVAAALLVMAGPQPEPGPPPRAEPGAVARAPLPPGPEEGDPVEVVEVARGEDIEIISVAQADAGLLVVGEHPHPGPLVWASHGDVVVEGVDAGPEEALPDMPPPADPAVPMLMNLARSTP